jgi:alpha-beta hydrolase superfamily lysophospholipase
VKGSHGYVTGVGGIRLHYRCWEVSKPRGLVIVVHGIGEHSGRYERLAHDFARAGLSTYALDHRGHGRSDGRRGHVRRFTNYLQDLERLRRLAVGTVGEEVPLVWLGHSLGGLVLARYLQEYPGVQARGAVFSAPLMGLVMEIPQWQEVLANLLYYAAPALPMSTGLPPEYLSHDREVVEAYMRDPLVHDRITPRTYGEIKREIEVAYRKVSLLTLPMLFLIPSEDKIVRPDLMHQFAVKLGRSKNVRVDTLAGLYHEVLNETVRSSVVADVLGWIERRIAVYSRPSNGSEAAG